MMDIRFSGDDAEGNLVEYGTWQELAGAAPWAHLNPDSLNSDQREFLVSEFTALVPVNTIKDGHVTVLNQPNPMQVREPCVRFAITNLAILKQDAVDTLAAPEVLAADVVRESIGAFPNINRTCVIKDGEKWLAFEIPPAGSKGFHCERLADLYHLGFEAKFTPLWHAIRLLIHAQRGRDAVKNGDAQTALDAGLIVGVSHRALGVKLAAASSGRKGANGKNIGSNSKELLDERNAWLRNRSIELRTQVRYRESQNLLLKRLKDELVFEAAKRGWRKISIGAIRNAILSK